MYVVKVRLRSGWLTRYKGDDLKKAVRVARHASYLYAAVRCYGFKREGF